MQLMDIEAMKSEGDIENLLNALHDENEEVRERAAEALGAYTDERVEEALRKAKFEDPVAKVKRAAARSHEMVVERMKEKSGEII